MKEYSRRLVRLFAGLAVMAASVAMTVEASLGLSPWDVLHDGISKLLGISFGTAGIAVGLFVVVLDVIFRERLGFGTVFNAVTVGLMIDLFLFTGVFPSFAHCEGLEMLAPRLALCVSSIFLQSFGMFLYMSAGLGGGPRDSFMCALARRSKRIGVGAIRLMTEGVVFAIGWLLGGAIGLGSIVLVACSGPIMALVFKWCRFDVKKLRHKTFSDTLGDLLPSRAIK